jgi:hypothetical protein
MKTNRRTLVGLCAVLCSVAFADAPPAKGAEPSKMMMQIPMPLSLDVKWPPERVSLELKHHPAKDFFEIFASILIGPSEWTHASRTASSTSG